ncbi:CpxP family protein [Vibrio sp. WXL103]|uniref:CpxP family protein n=1 Tax=unclassified Vibrio TaxID=2614977 RepID=UPI003EC70A67
MMKKVNKWLMAAAVIPLSLSAASAWAFGGPQGGHGNGGMGKCNAGRVAWKQLDLTEEQKAKFAELREANKAERSERQDNREEMKAQRDAEKAKVKALMLSDSFDQATAEELASNMVDKQTERRVKMLEKQHEMLQILTVEQREQLFEAKEARMEKCQERMQKKQQRGNKSRS